MQLGYHGELPTPLIFLQACQFEKLMKTIVIPESMKYMRQKGQPFEISYEEMCAFLGMIFMMGYHRLPDMKLYWNTDEDVHVSW